MTYPDFENTVLSEITDRYADTACVSLTNIKKNNGIELHGLIIHEQAFGLSPAIYLDGYYDLLCDGHSYDDVLSRIVDTYETNKRPIGGIADNFADFSWVREHIVMRLISRSQNTYLLNDVPFVPFLDMALCFAVRLQVHGGMSGSALIHNAHADTWGTDSMELFSYAKQNAATVLPPVRRRIEDMISEAMPGHIFGIDTPKVPMYVLTNTERSYGASVICYHGVLRELSYELGSDVYLIPSSVHEFIAVPTSPLVDIDPLNELIQTVNQSYVMPPEVLSDHVYLYHYDSDRITY